MRQKTSPSSWIWPSLLSAVILTAPGYGQDLTPTPPSDITTPADDEAQSARDSTPRPTRDWTLPENWSASSPTSTLVPKNVLRLRLPTTVAHGDSGWDDAGKKASNGFTANVSGAAFVAEYGVTDQLTVQILAPYVTKSALALDAQKFRQSKLYKKNYEAFLGKGLALMQKNGLCDSTEECLIEAETRGLPAGMQVTLPTGEVVNIAPNKPLTQYADSLVVHAAEPESGNTGLGDIELGVAYNFVPEGPVLLAFGLGLRLPTGSFKDVPADRRPTGSGFTTLGLRTYIDIPIVPGMILAAEHQAELSVTTAKRKKSSMTDPSQFNAADATSAAAIDAGSDGKSENAYERKGLRHVGLVRYKVGLGLINPALYQLGVGAGFDFDVKPETKNNGAVDSEASSQYWWVLTTSYDLIPIGIPLRFFYDYFAPIAGKETVVTTAQHRLQVHAFYRF